jgi:hypothetical protein
MGNTTRLTLTGVHWPLTSLLAAVAVLIAVLPLVGACVKAQPPTDTGNPVSPSSATAGGGPTTPSPSTPLAYTPDMKPVFDSDCVVCHSGSRPSAGYSMSTYTAVMRAVTPGSASSRLVTTTQPSGSMYRFFTGDRAGRAAMTRSWVVDSKAAQTR